MERGHRVPPFGDADPAALTVNRMPSQGPAAGRDLFCPIVPVCRASPSFLPDSEAFIKRPGPRFTAKEIEQEHAAILHVPLA